VDSVLFFAAKAEVERGDADMLQKRREVGTGAEGVEGELFFLARFGALGCFAARQRGDLVGRVGDVARTLDGERLERVRAADLDEAAAGGVGVEVYRGMAAQLSFMLFGPLGGSQQHRL